MTTLRLAAGGELQTSADRLAAELRDELTAVFERSGVPGRAYGASSTFHLLFGHAAASGMVDAAALKNSVPPGSVSAALHCSMLTEGVHLFHGSGFLSAAHGEREVEQTVRALATTLRRLRAAGLA